MALQELCKRKDDKYENALVEYNESCVVQSFGPLALYLKFILFYQVNKTFQKIKVESKQILEKSRHDLAAASEEIQKEYAIIEEVRLVYEKNLELAKKQGLPEPDASGVDFRTVDELQAELETQRANLDMNLNTNPGVVEEYEKRKRDVRVLSLTIFLPEC
jgi:structural maintenance of chromosomes protein 5